MSTKPCFSSGASAAAYLEDEGAASAADQAGQAASAVAHKALTESPKRKRSTEACPFSSPPRSQIKSDRFSVIPNTPARKRRRQRRRKRIPLPFSPPPLALQDSTFEFPCPDDMKVNVFFKGEYKVDKGHVEACIQQPPQKQSCGTAAALMLMTHFLQSDKRISLKDGFWHWYARGSLLDYQAIGEALKKQTNLLALGYKVCMDYYDDTLGLKGIDKSRQAGTRYIGLNNYGGFLQSRMLLFLKQLQDNYTSPLIVSITNEEIGGHWIVIDKILEDSVLIRDPYKGRAYRLSHKEMVANWLLVDEKSDEVKVIYLSPPR